MKLEVTSVVLKKNRQKILILRYQKIDLKSQLSHKGVPTAKSMNITTRYKGMPLYLATISFTGAEFFKMGFQIDFLIP